MKHLCIIVILAIFTFPSSGQSEIDLAIQQALQAKTLDEIENYKGKYKFKKEHWDLLNSEIVQTNYRLVRRKRAEMIGLLILSNGNEVIYSESYSWDFDKDFDGFEHEILDATWHDGSKDIFFIQDHLIRLPYRSTFGYACGPAGSLPREGQAMVDLVNGSNIKELVSWLNSINPVRQAYAYLGLSLLKARGNVLSEEIEYKMEKVQTSTLVTYSCYGCTEWYPEPLNKLLTYEQIDRFINKFLD